MRRAQIIALAASLTCTSLGARAAQQDVTAQLAIQPSGFSPDRANGTFDAQVLIRNSSSTTFTSPMWFVISGLPQGVSVAQGSGLTVGGLPYVLVPLPAGGLAPGGTASIIVRLNNPQYQQINPRYSILAESTGQELPPDPGPAGDATVAGVDTNGNGVRDDIERYIAFTYPSSQRVQKALQGVAIGYQAALLSTTTDAAYNAAGTIHDAQFCLSAIVGGSGNARYILNRLRAAFLNTWPRTKAYDVYNNLLGGASFSLPPPADRLSHCTFNPDSLPD